MRAGDLLRQLDRRLLPPLARGMARLGHGPGRLRVLTGVALFSSAAVLVTAVWAAERRPVGELTIGDVTRVGVTEGDSIPGYVEASRDELTALLAEVPSGPVTPTYALVTFTAYLGPDRLAPVLADAAVSEVLARVPLPRTQTQIVRIPAFRLPDDVIAGMAEAADRKDQEVLDYQRRRSRVAGDGERAWELRKWYDSGAAVARAEATAYRARCSCVYAAIVRADPVTLGRIAARPETRAVDPAPEVIRLDRAVFSPPLPDQHGVARPPADTGSTAVAGSGSPAPPVESPVVPAASASASDEPLDEPPDPTPTMGAEPSAAAEPTPSSSPDAQVSPEAAPEDGPGAVPEEGPGAGPPAVARVLAVPWDSLAAGS